MQKLKINSMLDCRIVEELEMLYCSVLRRAVVCCSMLPYVEACCTHTHLQVERLEINGMFDYEIVEELEKRGIFPSTDTARRIAAS